MLIKKTSPCLDSVIIYQNQHVELTLKLCFVHYVYIYMPDLTAENLFGAPYICIYVYVYI